jgi:MFS transporter, OFA family, oxalate/formate antiporter
MNTEEPTSNAPPFYAKWSNTPFAPAKCPFFYGWVVVAVSTMSIIFSMPGQTAGIGVFTDHIIVALSITREQLAIAYLVGTITSGLILPFAGKILDRIGVRFMSVFASIGLALSLLIFANVGNINTSLSAQFKVTWLAMIIVSFAFFLVRFFGQGNMTMVGRVAMGRWFNNRRGIATAIAGIPIAFFFNATPWMLNKLINSYGWQGACYLMAGLIGIVMTVIGVLLFRDNPEECGLTMDGLKEGASQQETHEQLHPVHHEFTRRQALCTVSFWAYVLGLAAHGLIFTAIAFHLTAIGQEVGKTEEQALLMFFYSSFVSIPARFAMSYLVDHTRFRLSYVLMMLAATIACYTLGLAWFHTTAGWIVTTVGLGLSGGTWGVLGNVTFPRYFGRKHLGAISGVYMSALVIASAIGPAYFSFGKMMLGSYRNAAFSTLVLPLIIFILAFFTSNPQETQRADNEKD